MTSNQRDLTVSDITMFHTPLHAIYEGQPVRLLATGDVEGKSPCYLVINARGESTWESFGDVRILDTNALPISSDTLEMIRTQTQTTAGQGRR